MLVLAAKIPQSSIKDNVRESAEYLCQGELFGTVIEDVKGSEIDRYADSILLSIAYQYDSEHPLESVMWSSYYYAKFQNENENLLEAVTDGYEPNQQYLRYWHGSNVFVRPLLTVFNLKQIYILNGIILIILVIWLMAVLIRNKAYVPAVGVLAGLIGMASWFVPFSLEYTWTYIIMLVMSIIGVKLALYGKWNRMGILFMVGGIITNYMDFLSTETLTLLVPLLLILWVRMHKENTPVVHQIKFAVKMMFVWVCGYLGMWLMKWALAAIVLQENVMTYVLEHISERLGGDIGLSLWQYITGAVLKNIKCLFPFEYGMAGMFAGCALVLMPVYFGYVCHKKHINKKHILLYLIIGLVPYIRYIVLHNHSYLHCFFTYRAQMATIIAIVLILEELTECMYAYLNEGKCHMVIGNRYAGCMEQGAMSWSHRVGVRFLSFCGRIRFHTDVYDFHCGLRGISRETAEKLTFHTDGMEFATEMIAEAAGNNLCIRQVPVKLRKCKYQRESKLRTVKDGLHHLRYILIKKKRGKL